jgi:hypothetical protein
MAESGSGLHSPDSQWWWNGERWLPAYSVDGRWWFNGITWVIPTPAWRRWTFPTGLAMLIVGIIGSTIGGLMVMGDPGPGQPVQPDPGWVVPVAMTTSALWVIGLGLLLAAPIQQMRGRRKQRRLQAASSREAH